MATVPYPDPRVSDLVERQAEDRATMNRALDDIRVEMRAGFRDIKADLSARRWSPSAISVVLGPLSAAIVAGVVVVLTRAPA